MNLLSAAKAALSEIGIPAPASLVGNMGTDAIQVLAVANAAALTLSTECDWTPLQTQYLFQVQSQTLTGSTTSGSPLLVMASAPVGLDGTYQVVGAGVPQDTYVVSVAGNVITLNQSATSTNSSIQLVFGKTKYPFPADYSRLINQTAYDKSRRWAMLGPASPQEWEWLKSSYISTGPRIRYRLFGGYIQTWPIVATQDTISFEYVSNSFALSALGVPQNQFLADTDTYIYPDRLMVTAIKYRYMEQRGLDYGAAFADYRQQLDLAKSFDGGAPLLSMSRRAGSVLINMSNVPDSGYGS